MLICTGSHSGGLTIAFRLKWYGVLSLNRNVVEVFDAQLCSGHAISSKTEILNNAIAAEKVAIFIAQENSVRISYGCRGCTLRRLDFRRSLASGLISRTAAGNRDTLRGSNLLLSSMQSQQSMGRMDLLNF